MITVNLNDQLSEAVELIATQQHQPVGKLIEQVLTDFLEDYRDARIAEQTIKEIYVFQNKLKRVFSLA